MSRDEYDKLTKTGQAGLRGQPPKNHPRRCWGIMRNGERCTQWALKGGTRCRSHGGWRNKLSNGSHDLGFMPAFYRKKLTQSLSEAVQHQLNLESDEQFSVLEELALMRESTGDFVQLYGVAHQAYEENPTDELLQAKLAAGELMRTALDKVVAIADKAAKIHFTGKNVFTALDLKMVVNQMTAIMFEICGTSHMDLAREYEHALTTKLALPSSGDEGTTITPDQDVIDMDSTIPSAPE